MAGEIVGGIRVRIPQQKPARNESALRPSGPAPRNGAAAPKPQAPAQPPQPSLADRFKQARNGMNGCTTVEDVNRWFAWAQKIPFTTEQHDALQELHSERTRELTAEPAQDDLPF
jgi:hypothetical protein